MSVTISLFPSNNRIIIRNIIIIFRLFKGNDGIVLPDYYNVDENVQFSQCVSEPLKFHNKTITRNRKQRPL